MTARTRVLALISTLTFGGESFGDGGREGFELLTSVAVHFEVSTEGITHFVTTATDILAEDEYTPFAAQLVDPRAMVPRHRARVDELGGEGRRGRAHAR